MYYNMKYMIRSAPVEDWNINIQNIWFIRKYCSEKDQKDQMKAENHSLKKPLIKKIL